MKPDELPLATLDLRQAGALLAHPCHCGRQGCDLGTHIWWATRDMTPGPRAQAFEPRTVTATGPATDTDPPPDPTARSHTEYQKLLRDAQNAARALQTFIGRVRPDRWLPDDTAAPLSDENWCANHLENFGSCELRHRGDLCRFCDDIRRLHGFLPDRPLMRARHEGRRITDALIADAKKRVAGITPIRTKKGRKAG